MPDKLHGNLGLSFQNQLFDFACFRAVADHDELQIFLLKMPRHFHKGEGIF